MDIEKLVNEVTREVQSIPTGSCKYGTSEVKQWEVPSRLEHSLLNPDVNQETILAECANARRYSVAAVCVAPYYVSMAKDALRGCGVKICAAIGFPHGCISSLAKLVETIDCIKNGADELDVAVNILAVKSGNLTEARKDLEQIISAARGKAVVKAVFEHSVYSDAEKKNLLEIAAACHVDFVKIQNVLSGKGAEIADIQYVRGILGDSVKIKIDGGVKTMAKALELINAGADRIGLTATVAIAKEAGARG